jgi:hypothetical protein
MAIMFSKDLGVVVSREYRNLAGGNQATEKTVDIAMSKSQGFAVRSNNRRA